MRSGSLSGLDEMLRTGKSGPIGRFKNGSALLKMTSGNWMHLLTRLDEASILVRRSILVDRCPNWLARINIPVGLDTYPYLGGVIIY